MTRLFFSTIANTPRRNLPISSTNGSLCGAPALPAMRPLAASLVGPLAHDTIGGGGIADDAPHDSAVSYAIAPIITLSSPPVAVFTMRTLLPPLGVAQ